MPKYAGNACGSRTGRDYHWNLNYFTFVLAFASPMNDCIVCDAVIEVTEGSTNEKHKITV